MGGQGWKTRQEAIRETAQKVVARSSGSGDGKRQTDPKRSMVDLMQLGGQGQRITSEAGPGWFLDPLPSGSQPISCGPRFLFTVEGFFPVTGLPLSLATSHPVLYIFCSTLRPCALFSDLLRGLANASGQETGRRGRKVTVFTPGGLAARRTQARHALRFLWRQPCHLYTCPSWSQGPLRSPSLRT